MPVPSEGEIQIVLYRLCGSSVVESAEEQGSAEGGGDLDIAQRGDVQIVIGVADRGSDPPGVLCAKKVFHDRGCVGDDDPQGASRDARSCLMRSAAGRPRETRPLLAIRSKTSAAGGRATSLSRISWT